MKAIQYIDEPNMILPLAASYNTRGIQGFTQAITNASDQRKVNSIYEPIKNAATGRTTLYLAKRPGVAQTASYLFSTSSQHAYLYTRAAQGGSVSDSPANQWLFVVDNTNVRAVQDITTAVIATSSGATSGGLPSYIDRTYISGADTVVLNLRNPNTGLIKTWYTTTASVSTFVEITDSNYKNLIARGKMEHLDGFALQASQSRINNSALNNISTWPATGFISRQTASDIGTGLAKLGRQIIYFGTGNMEIYRNAGTPFGSPLEAVPDLTQRYGLPEQLTGQRHYYCVMGGRLYWKGINPAGIFAYDGARVEKISTPAIDKIIADNANNNNSLIETYFVNPIGFAGKNAVAVGLDHVSSATQRALLFFPAWNDWFEWNSSIFIPHGGQNSLEHICLGTVGNSNKLFALAVSTNNWRDVSTDYTMTHQFKLPAGGNAHQQLRMFGVKGDTAASTTTSVLNVRFSTDDWQTSTAARSIDLTQGKKHIYRCGAFRDLAVYLDHTANLDCRLEAAVARIE